MTIAASAAPSAVDHVIGGHGRGRTAALACGAAAAGIGVAVIVGWLADIAALRSLAPGFPDMKLVTALGLVAAGASLMLLATRAHGALAQAFAALALAAGALTLAQYLFGLDLGIDRWLADPTGSPHPGRMPLFAAIELVLLGAALLALDARSPAARKSAPWLAQAAAVVSVVMLMGYAYAVSSLYHPSSNSSPVALHAALAFLLLAAGTLLARPERGPVAQVMADDAGGRLLRRLLPAALLMPPLLGWLYLQGRAAGLYGPELGIAVYAAVTVGVLALLVWGAAGEARRHDARQRAAEARTAVQLARLGLLAHITRAIGARHDLHSIFQVVVRSLEDHLPIDFGCVLLHDAAAGTLTVDAAGARGARLADQLGLQEQAQLAAEGDGLGRCLQGELVHEANLQAVPLPLAQRLAGAGLQALVLSPLAVEGKSIGLLAVARRSPGSFSSGDCEFLLQLGGHVALAAHQARLRDALQRAYDELHRSQQTAVQQERLRALGQMASGIAHDINNAISPMTLLTEHLLAHERGLSESGRESLGHIARSVDDVAATVARMRDFYRQRDARMPMAPMDLNRVVQQVVDLTRARWNDMPQQRGIVIGLHTELAPAPPRARGVESELRDALVNLVFNAVDAMPDGGRITLRTAATPAGGACVTVSDTGCGMDDDTRRRCLEPFFTTKGDRGTGLGLAMVYGMAERHGATLDIASEPGRGTSFVLGFPPSPDTSASDAPQAAASTNQPAPMRILLVDDDPMVLSTLKIMLEIDGHHVIEANSGQEGIDAFERELAGGPGVSVVMTDLGMPYVDGHQLARRVKALSPSTPVLLLTGWGAQGLRGEANGGEHIDIVLSKPPKLGDIRHALLRAGGQC
ncbi:hybrid sensor histidine kinase/response regulator [Ideonella sp.]|uniref:hybrid sensor histidine kinase/response regulator n=1 Tax=Ideonella sp. TaxID=1929293 RepID=UPI002B489EEC|nr:ATP-binding protein [Ideonella sp.]HJV68262.1 ATP-binding protein [Ideonella sp.]